MIQTSKSVDLSNHVCSLGLFMLTYAHLMLTVSLPRTSHTSPRGNCQEMLAQLRARIAEKKAAKFLGWGIC